MTKIKLVKANIKHSKKVFLAGEMSQIPSPWMAK